MIVAIMYNSQIPKFFMFSSGYLNKHVRLVASLVVTLVLSYSVLGSGSVIVSVAFRRLGWTPEVGLVFVWNPIRIFIRVSGCSLASRQS